jgi:hypothetical protein
MTESNRARGIESTDKEVTNLVVTNRAKLRLPESM